MPFDSFDAFLSYVETVSLEGDGRYAGTYGQPDWAGASNREDAIAKARRPWPEGIAQIDRARRGLPGIASPRSIVPQPLIAEEGDEVAIDRWLDGDSACWIAFEPAPMASRGRIIPVLINTAVSAMVSKEDIARRGALAVALVDALEAAGYRSEVTICERWETSGAVFEWSAIVKRPESPIELDRLAFAFLHPCVTRSIGFTLKGSTEDGNFWRMASQGVPAEIPAKDIPEDAIYFPSLHGHRREASLAAAMANFQKFTEAESA